MLALYLGLIGLLIFVAGVVISALLLRRRPGKENAERISRITQFLFFLCLGAPFLISLITPGVTHLDELVGISPLPWRPVFLVAGVLLALPGLYFLGGSNRIIRKLGDGANAFRLTKRVIDRDMYQRTRNPMSLGYYLFAIAIGFLAGSTLLTLYALFGLISAHLFYLKFFEEIELEQRFGETYRQYKKQVPFLIPKLS